MTMGWIVRVIFISLLLSHVFALKDGLLSTLINKRQKRIVNGIEAELNELKYQIFIHGKKPYEDVPNRWWTECSGSIISERHVLTAAHCIVAWNNTFNELELVVVPGIIDSRLEANEKLEVEVEKAYVPEEFQWHLNGTMVTIADIAVLKLKTKLDVGPNSSISKLILPPSDPTTNYVGMEALVSGFGDDKVEFEFESYPDLYTILRTGRGKLHKMHVRMIDDDFCRPREEFICAVILQDEDYGGICDGDSGSALVINNTVIGVVSASSEYCHNHAKDPGRYIRVSTYMDFINNAMKDIVAPNIRMHAW